MNLNRLLIVILLTFSFLNASNYVDLYRFEGIEAVVKKLEKELQEKSYWDEYLKGVDTSKGYYESIEYIVYTNKNRKRLKLYKKENNRIKEIIGHDVISGEKDGDKLIEGDLKTPIGAYELTKKLTKLDPFYGPLALVTSYPNLYDKVRKKTGHGIWIHGMPFNKEREKYTKGCVALDNDKLVDLDKKIDIKKSILIISENKNLNVEKNDISMILSFLFQWKESWKDSDIERYLSFYDKEFKRHNGMNLKRFSKYKKRIFAKKEKKSIVFKDINIIPYPNNLDKNMFKIKFHEDYRTKSYTFVGMKELFVEVKDNKVKILAEG